MRNSCPILAVLAFASLLAAPFLVAPAGAQDGRINWTGFYVGGHAGAMSGLTNFSDPDGPALYGGNVNTPGFLAGVQLGYNWQVRPQLVLGLEADASLVAASGTNTCLQSSILTVGSSCKVTPREIATLTGRFGVLTEPRGRTMLFAKAGAAWMRSDSAINQNNPVNSQDQGFLDNGITFSDVPILASPQNASISAWGATVGAGVEYALSSSWSLKMEYDYLRFGGMGMGTPPTSTVTIDGNVTNNDSSGTSSITQNIHLVKIGLNYRFGGSSSSERAADDEPPAAPYAPGWEFETGARYWYSSGTYRIANGGSPYVAVSQLTFDNMTAHSGELFARVDAPFGLFVKGFIGGGAITGGQMYDEDWGLPSSLAAVPTGFEITQSNLVGSLAYLTADIGYNLMRARDHKVGVFVGYNLYQATMNAMGCNQLAAPSSGVCSPAAAPTQNLVSQMDTWQSIRVGVAAEARLWERFKLGGDLAFLPYVNYNGLDAHRARNLNFPWSGTGNGVQAELIASYAVTDAFTVGLGGRYWAMWTNVASQSDALTNVVNASMDRYGVFLQASYKFNAPR